MKKQQDFLNIKSIRLLPEDFDSLDAESPVLEQQFTQPTKCVIARALTRMGFPTGYGYGEVAVDDTGVIGFGRRIKIEGSFDRIQAIARNLSKGRKYGVIKVLN